MQAVHQDQRIAVDLCRVLVEQSARQCTVPDGADADVAIYNEKPDDAFMFQYPRYVIKGGEVVVEEGDVRRLSQGREFVVRPTYDAKVEDYLRPLFQQYYTISFDNYPVEMERIERADVRECS